MRENKYGGEGEEVRRGEKETEKTEAGSGVDRIGVGTRKGEGKRGDTAKRI